MHISGIMDKQPVPLRAAAVCRHTRRRLQARRQGRPQPSPAVPRRVVRVRDHDSRRRIHRTRRLDQHSTSPIPVPLAVPTTPGREVRPNLVTDPCRHPPNWHSPTSQRQGQSKSTLQAFYSCTKPVIKVSVDKAAEMGAHFRSIDDYFRPRFPQAIFDVIL
jgi:hypothetical protein